MSGTSVSFKCENENFVIFADSTDGLNKEKYRIHGIKSGKTIQTIEEEISKIYAVGFAFKDCVIHYYFVLARMFDVPLMIANLQKMYPKYSKVIKKRNKLILLGNLTNCQIEHRIQHLQVKCQKCTTDQDCSAELDQWYSVIRANCVKFKKGRPKLTDNQRMERNTQVNLERKQRISEIYACVSQLKSACLTPEEIKTLDVSDDLKKKLITLWSTVCDEANS